MAADAHEGRGCARGAALSTRERDERWCVSERLVSRTGAIGVAKNA
jgi:hypothetical protein